MVLQIMKKGFLILLVLVVATSCSEYQKALKSEDFSVKYGLAEKLYKEGKEEGSNKKLKKALRLFEQVVPQYRGKPQAERVMFLYSDTYYQLEDYYLASYQFERFSQLYPSSEKFEEALFKAAKSHYMESPRYSLDQSETETAIVKLQSYINTFPEGEYIEEANELITELRVKLDKKAYEIAKQYHHTADYKSAIKSFDNFIIEHPGSPYRERAYYYKFDSAYKLAINSVPSKVAQRLSAAEDYYQSYVNYYPQGEYIEEAQRAYEDIKKRQTKGSTL